VGAPQRQSRRERERVLLPPMEMVLLPGKGKEEKEEGKVKRGRMKDRQREMVGVPERKRERR
jgi:hypothetical protein